MRGEISECLLSPRAAVQVGGHRINQMAANAAWFRKLALFEAYGPSLVVKSQKGILESAIRKNAINTPAESDGKVIEFPSECCGR